MIRLAAGLGAACVLLAQDATPGSFDALAEKLESLSPAAQQRALATFLVGRAPDDRDGLRARLRLAGVHLARLDGAAAAAGEFRIVLANAKNTDRALLARAWYGLAQCGEATGAVKEARAAVRRLVRDYRDLRFARLAKALGERLRARRSTRLGEPVPAFAMRDVDGNRQASRQRAGRAYYLAFFAPEDPRSVDRVQALYDVWVAGSGRAEDFVFCAVSDDAARVTAVRDARRWKGPVLVCAAGFTAPVLMDHGVRALPDGVLVGPDGVLLARNPRPSELRGALKVLRR